MSIGVSTFFSREKNQVRFWYFDFQAIFIMSSDIHLVASSLVQWGLHKQQPPYGGIWIHDITFVLTNIIFLRAMHSIVT